MKIRDIQAMPDTVEVMPRSCRGVHESTLRAYQILERVKDLLKRNVPADVVLELIDEMEDRS